MANEIRSRTLAVGGLVEDNPLTSGATTLTSAGLASLATIDTSNFATIILDPDGVGGAPEVVYVTAHTAAATTATIVRAREGSSARQHNVDVPWIHAPTTTDFPMSVDDVWGGDLGYDYEFNGNTTSLPSGWSWVNQGSATYKEQYGAGVLSVAYNASINHRFLVQALPSPATWTATIKLSNPKLATAITANAEFILRQSGTGKIVFVRVSNDGNSIAVGRMDDTAQTNNTTYVTGLNYQTMPVTYLSITRNGVNTSWTFKASHDGVTWWTLDAARDISAQLSAPDQIGFGGLAFTSTVDPYPVACHWFRVR